MKTKPVAPKPAAEVEELPHPLPRVRVGPSDEGRSIQIVWLRERVRDGPREGRTASFVNGDREALDAVAATWTQLDPLRFTSVLEAGYRGGDVVSGLPAPLAASVEKQVEEWRRAMADPSGLAIDVFFLDERLVAEELAGGTRWVGLRSRQALEVVSTRAIRSRWTAIVPFALLAACTLGGGLCAGFSGAMGGCLAGVLLAFVGVAWTGMPGGRHGSRGPRSGD